MQATLVARVRGGADTFAKALRTTGRAGVVNFAVNGSKGAD
jgi:hypothetical protein